MKVVKVSLYLRMAHHVYVLYSERLSRFYIGNTDLLPAHRLSQHNEEVNENAYTKKGIPWRMFLSFECESRLQSRKVELHIKKMKSKKYIEDLKSYPELIKKLLSRFKDSK